MYVRTYTNDDAIAAAARMCLSYLFLCGRNTQSFSPFPPIAKKTLPRKTEEKEGRSEKNTRFADFCGSFRHFAAVLAVDSSNVGISLSSFSSMRRTDFSSSTFANS